VNESLGHSSVIDYFICDTGDDIVDYSVLDPEINLSDHLPVVIKCKCVYSDCLPVAEALLKQHTHLKLNNCAGIMLICYCIITLR